VGRKIMAPTLMTLIITALLSYACGSCSMIRCLRMDGHSRNTVLGDRRKPVVRQAVAPAKRLRNCVEAFRGLTGADALHQSVKQIFPRKKIKANRKLGRAATFSR